LLNWQKLNGIPKFSCKNIGLTDIKRGAPMPLSVKAGKQDEYSNNLKKCAIPAFYAKFNSDSKIFIKFGSHNI